MNISKTCFLCESKVCNLIIDRGSMENVISEDAIENLKLQIEKHPHPYKIRQLKKCNEVSVTSRCLVKFVMGLHLENGTLCDIVPIDVSKILLGRSLLNNNDVEHCAKPNTYSFYTRNKNYTLHPLKKTWLKLFIHLRVAKSKKFFFCCKIWGR